jgi:flagellar basal-body rod protein FlgB
MKLDFFQNQSIDAMGAFMSRLSQRQQIVASNIANIDTPGYKTKDISFHATMQELLADNSGELRTENPEHNKGAIPVHPQVQAFEVLGLPSSPNQNNVDIDKEMLKMSETSFSYSLISQILRGKFRSIANSINEGKA